MRIPLNVLHWYLGFLVGLFIAARGIVAYRKQPGNRTTLYLALAGALITLAFFCYGLPPLLTTDPHYLSLGLAIGDLFQFACLFCIWLISIRAFFHRSAALKGLATLLALALTITTSVVAVHDDMSQLVTLTQAAGGWTLNYGFSELYEIFNAISFSSLLFAGIYFFIQSRVPQMASQKWRLRAFSAFFVIIGVVFIAQPLFDIAPDTQISSYLIATGFIALIALSTAVFFLQRQERKILPTKV